eukprot:CAMPEP_0172717732 /NCGR_PEP_ID=MMETSP1074-20121228/72353_1 /TAXON_ID=2916 /ORGANISM="Ceratium fusus, Strain PA161109" /LENGTH=225 /DNA_ID=CAMNT_0013542747 /DNA_START=1 /DNA_END=677 /DNA_ORIENTATION=+
MLETKSWHPLPAVVEDVVLSSALQNDHQKLCRDTGSCSMVPAGAAAYGFRAMVQGKALPALVQIREGPLRAVPIEHVVAELRGYGLMFDDMHNTHEPIMERAMELLPHDLSVGRYRRVMRAFEMNTKKTHLPVEEQNYDPMIPYLAPFMEEAKFQMQEEQELLRFHPWDRRLYSGPTTGLGENTPYSAFSVGEMPVHGGRMGSLLQMVDFGTTCSSAVGGKSVNG